MTFFSAFRPGVRPGLTLLESSVGGGLRARAFHGTKLPHRAPLPQVRAKAITLPRYGTLFGGAMIAAVGFSAFTGQKIECESARPYAQQPSTYVEVNTSAPLQEPKSMVNIYQLSFGTVCGICSGIFIKKGVKLLAFLLGGCYVFLQYLNSQRLVTVNWSAINNRYDKVIHSAAGSGEGGVSTGYSGSAAHRIWTRFTDFLTADFQPRATFMAGLLLGLRLG